jgi:hypothetical protein
MKVFVVFDPLYEEVLCVHKEEVNYETTGCEACKQAMKTAQKNHSYYPVGDWFEVQD